MADSGKKIIFEGVDNGAFNMLDAGKKKGIEMYNAFAKGALETAKNSKDAIKYIEDSIKAYERELKTLGVYKQHLTEVNVLKDKLYASKNVGRDIYPVEQFKPLINPANTNNVNAPTPIDVNKAKGIINSIITANQTGPKANALGQLTDRFFNSPEDVNNKQIHKFLSVAKSFNKDLDVNSLENKIHDQLKDSNVEQEKEADKEKGTSSLNEAEGIERLNQKTQELIDTLKDQHNEKIGEDRKNVEEEKKKEKKDSPEEILNKKIAEERAPEKEKQKSIFGEVLKANLVTEVVKEVVKHGKNIVQNTGNGLVSAEEGETMLAQTISEAIPIAGPIIGRGMERRNKEQFKVEQAANRLAGLTGTSKGNINDKSIEPEERFKNIKGANNYGYGMAETLAAEEQFTRSKIAKVSQKDTFGALALEKNFSLDRSTVSKMFNTQAKSSSDMSPLENVAQMIEAMPALKLDSTPLEDIIKLQTSMIEQNTDVIEKANRGAATSMIKDFRSIDSEFFQNPQRLAPIISSINNSLQSPANDFAKARNFKVLNELNPEADYFELIKMQSKGASQEGFLQKTIQETQKMGGDPRIALTGKGFGGGGILNLAPEVAEQIIEAFNKNPELFKGFNGNEDELMDKAGIKKQERKILGDAGNKVSVREKDMVAASDAFVFGVTDGMKTVAKQMGHEFVNEVKSSFTGGGLMTAGIRHVIFNILDKMFSEDPHIGNNGKRVSSSNASKP